MSALCWSSISAVSLANTNRKWPSKPYGCTFLTCNKLSCSKKDWKRHETLNIFISKLGTAMQRKLAVPVPSKVCYPPKDLPRASGERSWYLWTWGLEYSIRCLSHWQQPPNPLLVWIMQQACRPEEQGVDAWTERFDHIDDHFIGLHGRPKHPRLDSHGQW